MCVYFDRLKFRTDKHEINLYELDNYTILQQDKEFEGCVASYSD